ncbi:MAG: class I SAM-dependent methyltransferase [Gemmataceae bacterium]
MRLIIPTFLLPFLALSILLAAEPTSDTAKPRYEYRADHDPHGTGKFYMGREIALVMGHQAAGWLDRPEREREEQPSKLLELLKIPPGAVVADIGSGSGYHTLRLAQIVGPRGKVYGVDVQKEMLALLRRKAEAGNYDNIIPILGTPTDPKLPANALDLILMVDVYHEFSHPYEMIRAMIPALKANGRLVFVEFRLEDTEVPIKRVHKMSERQVLKEMRPHPELVWDKTLADLPWQHVILFHKKAD